MQRDPFIVTDLGLKTFALTELQMYTADSPRGFEELFTYSFTGIYNLLYFPNINPLNS
jgi:hypothetical protein